MATRQVPGFCTLCRSRCGTLNTVEAGRLIRVDPDPSHPTGRAICSKGRAAPEIAHGSRRLTSPMRRTRPKTETDPGWEPVGWDEAMTEIAERLEGHRRSGGPESVAFAVTSPSGTPISDAIEWIERFIRLFGSPNTVYATEICNWHKDHAHAFTYGAGIGTPDYANADLILLWGHNPASVWLAQAGAIAEGQRHGAKLVVVDPRRTAHAGQADHWLRVCPGTDAALALGLLRQLIITEGYDDAFVRRWTNAGFLVRCDDGRLMRGPNGFLAFDEHRQAVAPADDVTRPALHGTYAVDGVACRPAFALLAEGCASYTPERVEAITTVPAANVIATATALANARSVAYYCWTGVGQTVDATQTDRALAVLMALTGSHDTPGGNREYARQPVNKVNGIDLLPPSQARKALGLAQRPLGPPAQGWVTAAHLYDAILESRPYPVRALMSFGANILLSHADPVRAEAALRALDFHVHCDLIETPTARFADILLPVNSPWEREGLRVGFEIDAAAEELIQLRQRMVEPVGESRSDMDIVFDLAVRLGLGGHFFDGDPEAGWNHVLEPLNVTVAELRARPAGLRRPVVQQPRRYATRSPAFPTETGRIEVYSERLLRHGHAPIPCTEPSPEPPDEAFPLVLTSAKSGYYCHSQQRGIASLRRRAAEPTVQLASELAAARGIRDGDWVVLRSRAGQARFKARLNPALHARVLVADYGWWQACPDLGLPGFAPTDPDGSNYNALIASERCDPISGSVPMRAVACEVQRETAGLPGRWRPLRLAALEQEAEDVVSATLAADDGEALVDYLPGQHLPLRLDAIAGHASLTRSYSLSGPATVVDRTAYRITVKRVPGGIGSGHITRTLKLGETVLARAPTGRFVIPTAADFPVVMLAAGIGITPFIAALETLACANDAIRSSSPRMVLHYGSRNSNSQAFRERLCALRRSLPGFALINHYSQPTERDRAGRDFDFRGRITVDAIAPEFISDRARFYVCGPTTMLRELTDGLIGRGVPPFEIFQEAFEPMRAAQRVAGVCGPYQVRFARSGRTVTWHAADGSLLDLAEGHGLSPPSGCRVGQCESCAVTVLAGAVGYLREPEHAEPGACLTCQAVPLGDLVLDA